MPPLNGRHVSRRRRAVVEPHFLKFDIVYTGAGNMTWPLAVSLRAHERSTNESFHADLNNLASTDGSDILEYGVRNIGSATADRAVER